MPITEDRLLEAARGGDETAFAGLIKPYERELHAHCYRMLGSMFDADDALQDAELRAWKALKRFEGRSSLRSWLYTIATNTCLTQIQRRPKRVLPIDYGPAPTRSPVPASRSPRRSGSSRTRTPSSRTASPARRRATSSARASSWPSSPRSSTCPPPSAPS